MLPLGLSLPSIRFYAKGVNCCAELRIILDSGPDGGDCPPVGMCRGFESCSELMTQFADVPVLPDFPDGLADWVCEAFPNDDNQVDNFIVSLIALAVALPVTYVLQTCFEIANDNEAPESWLEWVGWRKLVFGPAAHRRWNYTQGPQPVRHVRWFVRSVAAPKTETAMNLYYSAKAWLTGTLPPWTIEAREADEEAAAARAEADAEEAEKTHGKKDAGIIWSTKTVMAAMANTPPATATAAAARAAAARRRLCAALAPWHATSASSWRSA